jgi:hypothetical protein
MRPNFKPPFSKFVKKQHLPLQLAIEDAVEEICENFRIGELKSGDLQGVRVFKFTHNKRTYLIAYRPPTEEQLLADSVDLELLIIDFYQAGTHENFYSDLKKYLKS